MGDDENAVKASGVVAAANEEATEMEESVGGGGGGRGGEEEAEDDVEGEEEEEEDEEEDDDEGYTLRFDGDTDPLGLVQEDNHGVDLYQQFERLEYEALAERKRKAVSQKEPPGESVKKPRREDVLGVTMEEINELMNFGRRRRSRASKKRGRKRGSKKKLSPEISRRIGDATLYYTSGDYDEAIPLLEEVVRLAPNLSDAYYILGLIYDAKGDRGKALNFHMIAAHLSPKDPSLWKKLVAWSIEQKNTGQIKYCLKKAITADPKDVGLRFDLALLYCELGEYQKAAESYDQIVGIYPANIQALKMAAKMYQKCGLVERAIKILEDHVNSHVECDNSVINLLIALYIENGSHMEALKLIERACSICGLGKKNLLYLKVKEAVCHAQLGNMQHAEFAVEFYSMLEDVPNYDNGKLHLKIAQCFLSMEQRGKAIAFYYKALSKIEDDVDARITLSSLLLEEGKDQETINLLSPPKVSAQMPILSSAQTNPWWKNGKIKMQLAKIYHAKGKLEDFVDTIYSYVRETLVIEIMNRKVRPAKKISKSVLFERVKLLDDQQADNLFRGFKPVARMSELVKAVRAKKSLQKLASLKEEKKAAALAAGLDWQSDSDDELPRKAKQEPPLPDLLKDVEHHQFILDVDIAYSTRDPKHGYNYVRYIVQQHPHSIAAWNCYYKVVSRLEYRFSRHLKFLHHMRVELKDCVMPMIIYGHQFTMISQHQSAAREYLEAYKVQPKNPLINLCVGTALINLALGFRLQKKHYCVAQGFAFLYKYLRICNNSQEALYNIARAYQHVGLVTLAAIYYEKVLAMQESDYPIPKLPYEDSSVPVTMKPGYCNLHREAAYNLHLIYKKSGATDLARQLLKNYCSF
ncbi:general transcription factor 3C polypeptide [Musa troglodytarum]|uniref:General transcription factor 3C polypeptide n=1 Tax=Musa troglodytarum TaxID=320322 RepID=A0A9E7IAV6_9LILI|nr:general transcription factor 3C polypeptide [Musa troglodytarum]